MTPDEIAGTRERLQSLSAFSSWRQIELTRDAAVVAINSLLQDVAKYKRRAIDAEEELADRDRGKHSSTSEWSV